MKDDDCLLGGCWYPWFASEVGKQFELATLHANHINNRAHVYCEHIEAGFKSCPRKWKKERLLKYIQDFKQLKINKNNVIDIFKRTILMHDLLRWDEPSIIKLFLEKDVILDGCPAFPPFIQHLCYYTPSFVKTYNSLVESDYHLQYNVECICEIIRLLLDRNLNFRSPIWIERNGMYEPHGTRTILNELFGRLHSRKIFDLIFPIILIDEHNPSELINNATREACKFANIDLLKYLVENHSNVIDRDIHLHSAVSGGSLKCVEIMLAFSQTFCDGICYIPSGVDNDGYQRPLLQMTGTAFECAKKITQTDNCIRYEEDSAYPYIIDILKKRESEKKPAKKKPKNKKKNKGKQTPDIQENIENMENMENKENNICNGHNVIAGQKMSDNMEKDLIGMMEMVEKLKVKEKTDDTNIGQSSKIAEVLIVKQKDRAIQTLVNVKDKGTQTLGEDSLSKQIDQRDRKILEMEKIVKTLKKQTEKCTKLEKDLTDTKSLCQRQSKELENLKSHKKRVKDQNDKIDELTRKLDETDRHASEEKRINKTLKTQQTDSITVIRDLRSQLANLAPVSSPSPSISSEDYDSVIVENRSLKEAVNVRKSEYQILHAAQAELRVRYKDKTEKLNETKMMLKDSYQKALRLETIVSMYPDKEKIYHMSENLMTLREQLKTSNDFEQNGVTSQNPKILEENISLKKENQALRRIKDAFDKLEWLRSCRICELDYEPIGDRKRIKLRCSHVICKDCAEAWLNKNTMNGVQCQCPFCSASFTYENITPIHLA